MMKFLLAATLVAIASVRASPFFDLGYGFHGLLESRDLSGSTCVDFVYGNTNIKLGQVCVTITADTLTIQYPDISPGTYSDVHAQVQTAPITECNQAKWAYSSGNGACTITGGTAKCTIPVQDSWRSCSGTLNIAVHASFLHDGGTSDTGWGNGPCIPGCRTSNCPKSFTMSTTCSCPVVTVYSPIVTSTTIEVIITSTSTVFCTSTPAPVTTSTSCDNPSSAPTNTITTTTTGNLVCPSPT